MYFSIFSSFKIYPKEFGASAVTTVDVIVSELCGIALILTNYNLILAFLICDRLGGSAAYA